MLGDLHERFDALVGRMVRRCREVDISVRRAHRVLVFGHIAPQLSLALIGLRE